eukprot:1227081-Pyramimonas_sp.AAC.1
MAAADVARLKGDAFEAAQSFRCVNPGTRCEVKGLDALCLPQFLDDQRRLVLKAGLLLFLDHLKSLRELHDQDKAGICLDEFFDYRRTKEDLMSYVTTFKRNYNEARDQAGLVINEVGLSHLLLSRSGLPEQKKDDVRLKMNFDMAQHEVLSSTMCRMAKQEQA